MSSIQSLYLDIEHQQAAYHNIELRLYPDEGRTHGSEDLLQDGAQVGKNLQSDL